MRTARFGGWVGPLVLAIAFIVSSRHALAQPGRGGMGLGPGMQDGLEPGISSRDVERYARFFGMNEGQTAAAKALLDGYQSEFEKGARGIRDIMDAAREEFRDTRDFSVWEDVRGTMEAWREKRTGLEKTYFSDFKDLLSEQQAAEWAKFERLRRRDSTMRRGLISGESVDVIRLVDGLKLAPGPREALQPALDQYELELDRALAERNEAYERGMSQGFALWRSGDVAAIQSLFDKGREAAVKVRDINRRAARHIEGLLPDERRAEFDRDFRVQSFPRVYGESFASRTISSAQGFKDLTPEQAALVKEIQSTYEREAGVLNDRMAKAIEDSELTQTASEMMTGGGGPAVREARLARRELDDRTVDRLQAVLTADQKGRLPGRRGREGGSGGGAGRSSQDGESGGRNPRLPRQEKPDPAGGT